MWALADRLRKAKGRRSDTEAASRTLEALHSPPLQPGLGERIRKDRRGLAELRNPERVGNKLAVVAACRSPVPAVHPKQAARPEPIRRRQGCQNWKHRQPSFRRAD